jgi:hypothetical protein
MKVMLSSLEALKVFEITSVLKMILWIWPAMCCWNLSLVTALERREFVGNLHMSMYNLSVVIILTYLMLRLVFGFGFDHSLPVFQRN